MNPFPSNCKRCGAKLGASTMSMFNTQMICMDCSERERKHPKYREANEADINAIKAGNFNFPGIGLPQDLKVSK